MLSTFVREKIWSQVSHQIGCYIQIFKEQFINFDFPRKKVYHYTQDPEVPVVTLLDRSAIILFPNIKFLQNCEGENNILYKSLVM